MKITILSHCGETAVSLLYQDFESVWDTVCVVTETTSEYQKDWNRLYYVSKPKDLRGYRIPRIWSHYIVGGLNISPSKIGRSVSNAVCMHTRNGARNCTCGLRSAMRVCSHFELYQRFDVGMFDHLWGPLNTHQVHFHCYRLYR